MNDMYDVQADMTDIANGVDFGGDFVLCKLIIINRCGEFEFIIDVVKDSVAFSFADIECFSVTGID